MLFLEATNKRKFAKLLTELSNDYIKGTKAYPSNMEEGLDMVVAYTNPDLHKQQGNQNKDRRGTSFAQKKKKITCYACGEEGHIAPNCPAKKRGQEREQSHVSDGQQ